MGSVESHLEVINKTNKDITNTSVSGVDNYDWDGNSRPDHNFQGIRIPARGGSVQRREELNKNASHCPFNMTLHFSDGSVDEFRIHQRHAIGCCANFNHMRRSHDITYNRVNGNKLVITIQNTQQQLQNEKAEEKNREGEAAVRQKQYEAAMKKFDEALGLANQSSTINTVKTNKSQACTEIGKVNLQKAWDLEADTTADKSQEAQSKFNEARNMFQQAQNLQNSSEHQKNLNIVNSKIDGNRLFNEANEIEKQAFKLFENARSSHVFSDYTAAKNKYNEALAKYEEANKKFEEGTKMEKGHFEESAKITAENIQQMKKTIDDIDQAELNYNINKVNIDDEKKEKSEEKETVNTNLQEQVDVVTN